MKRTLSVLMVIVCCMSLAVPVQAQLLKWGVKGGVNMSKLDFTYENAKENSTGFFIGPMAEVTIPVVGLGVDAAVLYSQRGDGELKQQGLDIPINLKYTIGLGSMFGVFIAAGPDFFFNFKDIDIADLEAEKRLVSLNVGAGIKLIQHLQIGVNYNIPLGDSFKLKNVGDVDSKYRTWQVSLAYMF